MLKERRTEDRGRAAAPDGGRPRLSTAVPTGRPRIAPAPRTPAHLLTRAERWASGKALRAACPREAHAESTVQTARGDPVELLMASSQGRIPALVPIRYGRMLASPFAFYRGAASVMAADLAGTPSSGLTVQACGDCHLMNFGAFATPERRIVFDINDFDETHPAPWEWDLKRLAASFVIASRHNGHKPSDCRAAAVRVVGRYRDRLVELARGSTLAAWYASLDYEALVEMTDDPALRRRRRRMLSKALARDAGAELVRLATTAECGSPRIRDMPPLVFHPSAWRSRAFAKRMRENLERYRASLPIERRMLLDRYALADVAIKVVGVGSVGTLCAVALLFAGRNDPLFLQIKEARESVLQPYVPAAPVGSHGERVVHGQRLMQCASDIFLGHLVDADGRHLYVRQLRDVKIKPLVELFSPRNMLGFARNTGWALARAHARSADPARIAGYIGRGDALPQAIADFAMAYADRNERDYAALAEAARRGRITAAAEAA